MIGRKKWLYIFLRENHSSLRPEKNGWDNRKMEIDGTIEEEDTAADYSLQDIWFGMVTI